MGTTISFANFPRTYEKHKEKQDNLLKRRYGAAFQWVTFTDAGCQRH